MARLEAARLASSSDRNSTSACQSTKMAPSGFLDDLQTTMSYRFKNSLFLEKTLIAGDTNSNDREGNRGMAQLGDSLMSTVVFSDGLERGLSRNDMQSASSYIRSKEFCSRIAKVLHLAENIRISERQMHIGIQPTVLKNAVAALIGAAWLDSHDYGTVLRVMLSIGLLNHAQHHDELQDTLLMNADPFDGPAIPWQHVEASDDQIDGDYWALLSESDRCFATASGMYSVGESMLTDVFASTVPLDGVEGTPMHTPPASPDSLRKSAEHVCQEIQTASASVDTTETVTRVERDEGSVTGQAEREMALHNPHRTISHSTGKVIKRTGRGGKMRRPGRPRADSVRDTVEAYVVRETLKEQGTPSHRRVYVADAMSVYLTTILDAPVRSQHCLVALATSIGDSSALLLLREAMQGLRTELTSDALLVDRRMSTKERIDVINHIGACSALFRILRFLHIVTLWEDLSGKAQDGSNNFIVATPSSVAQSTAKKGNPLFLARTDVSQGFSVPQDRQVEILPIDKTSDGTHLRRLGQRLGLMAKKWGQGALLFLGQQCSDHRMLGPNDRDFGALITRIDKFEGTRISAVSAAASGILRDFVRGNRLATRTRLDDTSDDAILGLPRLSPDFEILLQAVDQ